MDSLEQQVMSMVGKGYASAYIAKKLDVQVAIVYGIMSGSSVKTEALSKAERREFLSKEINQEKYKDFSDIALARELETSAHMVRQLRTLRSDRYSKTKELATPEQIELINHPDNRKKTIKELMALTSLPQHVVLKYRTTKSRIGVIPLDIELKIKTMLKNRRKPPDIAKELGISVATVHNRKRAMLDSGGI